MPSMRHDIALGRIREIVAAVLETDLEAIIPDAHFYDDLSVDSLEKVEIAVRIEREFEVPISPDEAAEVSTVADALELLRAKGVTV